ncbi:MAG: isochorismatase family protein [Xanthomonadales bacterium]|nr:isochorismatase family protein [Xanthomonadales bacterium]
MPIPDRNHTASFDVDAQCTFTPLCPDELPVPEGDQIVPELNAQAQFARLRVASKDAHSPHALWIHNDPAMSGQPGPNGPNMDTWWPHHAEMGSKGFELIPGLPAVTEYDYFVWKGIELDIHPYGACYHDLAEKMSTGVIEYLKSQSITTVLVGGLALDFCVKTTALQLRRADFRVVVNMAACRGIAEDTCQQAIAEMTAAGIEVVDDLSDWERAAC